MLLRPLVTGVVVALLGASLTGCTDDDDPVRQADVNPTRIADFVAASVSVQRAAFCERVADDAVAAVVGEGAATRHYESGQRVALAPGVRDRVHEDGCRYVGRAGDQAGDLAEAWVFAPPVTPGQARTLVAGVRRTAGCRPVDGHDFGSPGIGTVCTTRGRAEASYRGLFGDAWLTCSVTDGGSTTLTRAQLLAKAGDWCVQVATAASD